MFYNNILNVIKRFPFLNLIKNEDGVICNLLKVLGSLISSTVGGWIGFSLYGWLGATFGFVFSYVIGKLLIKQN